MWVPRMREWQMFGSTDYYIGMERDGTEKNVAERNTIMINLIFTLQIVCIWQIEEAQQRTEECLVL